MREDNKRQDMLIAELKTRHECDATDNKRIPKDSKFLHGVSFHNYNILSLQYNSMQEGSSVKCQ